LDVYLMLVSNTNSTHSNNLWKPQNSSSWAF